LTTVASHPSPNIIAKHLLERGLMPFRFLSFAVASFLLLVLSNPTFGQAYTWNNTGTDWNMAGSWNPSGGPPGADDSVFFNVEGTFGNVPIQQPTWSSAPAAFSSLNLSTTAQFTGWNFTTNGTLEMASFRAIGPGTHTFNGTSLQGAGGDQSIFRVWGGSTVELGGSSIATDFTQIRLSGGTLRLNNSETNVNPRTSADTTLFFNSGTIHIVGNASGTDATVGAVVGEGTVGLNTFRFTPNGGALAVNFNNTGTDFSTRLSPHTAFRAEATSGELGRGGSADPKMTYTGTPALGANGLLSSDTNPNAFGHFTVSGVLGVNFATWDSSLGVKAAPFTSSPTTAANLSTGNNTSHVHYRPGAGTQTAPGEVTVGAVKITPSAAGATLAMESNNLQTVALMLNGPHDYTISGTGTWASSDLGVPRYLYVNDPAVALSTSLVIASGSSSTDNATNIIGPGHVILNRNGSQNTTTNGTRINLLGGTLRANNTQLGLRSSGNGSLVFSGGVLEIQNGANGTGASADFTRTLQSGDAQGAVRWQGGNGGFSAYGSTASVNIGGNSTPNALTWGANGFVENGYALMFGSTRSNATLRFLNSINLGGGTTGDYQIREIKVTQGEGNFADKTLFTNSITGATTTDLLKTGNGVLELLSGSNHRGNTLIHGGTLTIDWRANFGQSGAPTGNVVVGNGARFAGAGTVWSDAAAGKSVIVNPGGTIRGGNTHNATYLLGTLTINSNLSINSTATDLGTIQFEASRTGANAADASRIALGNTFQFNLNPGSGNKFEIELVDSGLLNSLIIGETYTVTLATVQGGGVFRLNGSTLSDGVINPSYYVLTSPTYHFDPGHTLAITNSGQRLDLTFTVAPIPEPAAVLVLAAGILGFGALARRRKATGAADATQLPI
jgi:autotransporter-associated beta strand protein